MQARRVIRFLKRVELCRPRRAVVRTLLDDPDRRSTLRSLLERWRDRLGSTGVSRRRFLPLVRSGLTSTEGVADHVRAGMEVMSDRRTTC
jgi:hypothetical protein